jgi:hypothetical protein
MSRITVIGLVAAFVGLIAGAGIALNMSPLAATRPSIAVVDLAGIVERQRTEVLKQAGNPEAAEKIIADRMIRLATVLADMGRERVILNKAAVVTGTVTDLTGRVEARLSGEGAERR